jgi:hypothetical protein
LQIQEYYVHTFVLPALERRYGFETEVIATDSYEGRAVVRVAPNGAFARFGVRPYDVPFGYPHGGGWISLCAALEDLERGRRSSFEVVNVQEGSAGSHRGAFRTIDVRP